MHAQMWADRLRDEPRFEGAVRELWPFALGVLRPVSATRSRAHRASNRLTRSSGTDTRTTCARLWEEMTMVRRSVTGATW